MSNRLVIIYRARESYQAHLLRNLLADYDIEANVTGDALSNAGSEFVHSSGFAVMVDESQAELAQQIAEAFQRHVVQAKTSLEEVNDEASLHWNAWPICPHCRARQTAICVYCGERGDDFPLAEWQGIESPSPEEVLLVCGTCDDVFHPQFYRDCPWCGFHFGTGLEPLTPADNIDFRLVFGVILASLAVLGYLWILYR